jgi:hypothetical protein
MIDPERVMNTRPIRAVDAEMETTPDGGGKLKVPMQPPRWGKRLFRLPAGATKTFEFDPLGVFVWEQIDGKTSVKQIVERLSRRYKLNLREAQVPTIRFLQMLMSKHLIGVRSEKEADPS